ncbi:Uncharacterized protein APZ42_011846 [Daphnia magna]|uniref:Uncharacterized protein n=1 Tax=Daphnia magna TaxID=35525 RepID=A0A162SG62_9CRUS|nr:Uncharacterized protein APZ42_011846 [Daphnia magna]
MNSGFGKSLTNVAGSQVFVDDLGVDGGVNVGELDGFGEDGGVGDIIDGLGVDGGVNAGVDGFRVDGGVFGGMGGLGEDVGVGGDDGKVKPKKKKN